MGKSRRNRGSGQKQRSDPMAGKKDKPVKPPTDPELAALREKSVLPVLRDLQSADPKRRTAAAAAVAHVVARDERCRKLLLRERVVGVLLGETLTDSSLEGRAAGWQILRTLAAEEGPDFCVHLYRVDVVTAVQHAAKKITEALTSSSTPFGKTSKAEQNFVWTIAEALTPIITGLAEASDEAFDAIVRNADITSFLLTLLSADFAPASVLENALLCMSTLSEDNLQFVEAILADEATKSYERLQSFQKEGGYKAVLACSILHNVFAVMEWHDQNPGKDGASDAVLVPTLSQSLEQAQSNGNMPNGHGSSSPADILRLALQILASIGTTLQESLEKGNKEEWGGIEDKDDAMDADVDAGSDDDEERLSEKGEPADDDDEMGDGEMEADMEMVTAADDYPDEASRVDDLPTLRELLHRAMPQVLMIIARTTGDDEASLSIRSRAFATLNNVSWTVSCMDFGEGQNAAILRAWSPVARTIWRGAVAPVLASDTSDVGLATVVTSLAWAVARTLHYTTGDHAFSLSGGGEHEKFMSLYHASKNLRAAEQEEEEDPFQSLGVKCVGVLGQLALDPGAPLELNREVGVFLLTQVLAGLPVDTPPADAVEALNQLFDIYGDESKACDREVFWRDDFLRHLEEVLPKFRAAVKTVDKRRSAELRQRADETLMNLTRFIQYKQKHRP
ncbi:hypothetical protein DL764_006516 [Monosporascus ibericus]|uniref:SYO1-like TPR repeats domain-containing protein n=1 Tax=Monosporascus ibericus TaxID=155417 RepID=A0A4Q4T7Z4_9PEZI|nr:hypothetical protein DL764_006516 [Monosporascus ibericus]